MNASAADGRNSPRRTAGIAAAFLLAALMPALAASLLVGMLYLVPFAFTVTIAHALLLGMPVFVLAYRKGWINVVTCTVGAFVIGAVPVGILSWPLWFDDPVTRFEWLRFAQSTDIFGLFGALGGLAFWSTLRLFGVLPHRASPAS